MQHQVLVVEDDVEIRETLIEVLADIGVGTLEASNGEEALEALRRSAQLPCLIFLDMMMPIMDGRAFREAQLNQPALKDIPVVILSAYRDVESMVENLNVARVLRKPVRLNEVRSSVEQFCLSEAQA